MAACSDTAGINAVLPHHLSHALQPALHPPWRCSHVEELRRSASAKDKDSSTVDELRARVALLDHQIAQVGLLSMLGCSGCSSSRVLNGRCSDNSKRAGGPDSKDNLDCCGTFPWPHCCS